VTAFKHSGFVEDAGSDWLGMKLSINSLVPELNAWSEMQQIEM
jgi:hypothetical protein